MAVQAHDEATSSRRQLVTTLKAALVHAETVRLYDASRENSLAITHLEDALFRAQRDCRPTLGPCPMCGAKVGAPCMSLSSNKRLVREQPHFYRGAEEVLS